jgi:putative ABC transport system permease protein
MAATGTSSASIFRRDGVQVGRRDRATKPGAGFWSFALRNLLTRPARTGLAMIGLSIPVLGVLGLFSLSSGIRNLLVDTLAQIQGIIVLRENAPTDLLSDLPATMANSLRQVPGVRVVAPQVWKIAPSIEGRSLIARSAADLLTRPGNEPLKGLLNMVQIAGQDIAEHARLRSDVYRNRLLPPDQGGGRFLDESDRGRPNIVISTTIAREYPGASGQPRQVGDPLRIGSQTFTIVGIYSTGSMLLDHAIVMDLGTARQLMNLKNETVSCFLVEPASLALTDEVAGAIERAIPGVDARTMSEFQLGAGRMLTELDLLLLLILSLAVLVGSIGILNTMLMSTSERLAEFGIMRSNGWSRGDVLRLLLAESVCLGLLAGLAGCLLALAAVRAINPFLDGGLRLVITPGTLLLGMLLALALGTLGGIYPAWRASRLAPMEIIRRGSR